MARRIPARLLTKARRLKAPADYYHGVRSPEAAVPDNILLFNRLTAPHPGGAACHHRFVLIANLQGSGSAIVDESVTPLASGDAILVFPYQFHHYANFTRHRILWLFVTFEAPDAARLMPLRNASVSLSAEAIAHLDRMCDLFTTRDAERQLALYCGLVLEGMVRSARPTRSATARGRGRGRGRGSGDVFQRIGTFIYEHLHEPLQIKDIAAHVSLSESHLRNTFKEAFGIPLARYVRHAKLTRAACLVATTDGTMTEIGESVGFESLYSFSRAFKSDVGVSPLAYRRATKLRRERRS